MKNLTQLATWQALQHHYEATADHSIQQLFANDPDRFANFSLKFSDILFDFSKNRINQQTISLLIKLAEEMKLADAIQTFFSGGLINFTENRPALHTALRDKQTQSLLVNGHNVMSDIHSELNKMQVFSDQVRNDAWLGATGKPIRDIVNIGIGGSHLGPMMVTQALSDYADPKFKCYFISNIDGSQVNQVLQQIRPEQTLFIISSKSFTTIETLTNTQVIKIWLQEKLGVTDVSAHFIAVTAAAAKAEKFGIAKSHIFAIWDWIGGRYSVWSAIGLPIAIMIGMQNFYAFLDGAHAMDEHFKTTPFATNIPVIMALLGIWYINFYNCDQHAIVPYAHELNYFRDYIHQLDMESNGKVVTRHNTFADYATGPIIFGQQGCDSQHSFFQLMHQGPRLIPIDFILSAQSAHFQELQDVLVASALSQAQALMVGRSYQDAFTELKQAGYNDEIADRLAKHKIIPGNRPSNILFLKKITPYNLGALIALYEHKIFVQGILWDINSFDQWGVELGKQLLPNIMADFQQSHTYNKHDTSTAELIRFYMTARNA